MKRLSTFKIFLLLNIIFLAGCSDFIQDFKAVSKTPVITVAFDSNSDDESSVQGSMDPQLFTKNLAQPLSQNMYKKENYAFLGWADESSATEVLYKDEELFTAIEDTTLYAVWGAPNYRIICQFQNLDGSGTGYDVDEENSVLCYGDPETEISIIPQEVEGFTAEDVLPFVIEDPETVKDVYITYNRNKYTVTFAADGSEDAAMDSVKALYQEKIKLDCSFEAPDVSKKFAGWTDVAEGDQVVYTNGAELEITGDLTLYALWMDKGKSQYKVIHLFQNLSDDEYTENEDLAQVLEGYAGAETAAAALTVTGFAPVDFEQCKITADDSAVVEIKYDRIPVVLSFELADGTMTSPALTDGNLILKYGSEVPVPVVEKNGFNFINWTPALPDEAVEDGLFTAVWEKIVYPCPVCGTVYDTEEEKDKCNVQEGCPEYVKTYTYDPGEEGGLSGTTTEEQGAEAKPSVNIDGEEMDNTKELNIVPKDTIAIIDTDGSKIWDPEGTGNVAVNVQGAFLNGRKIVLSPYIISQYPVTTKLYKTVMGKDPSDKTRTPMEPYDLNPVNSVTWYDAVIFCNKLSEIEELEPVYYIDVNGERVTDTAQWIEANYPLIRGDHKKNGYRLPTNAEWEFAARGGDPSAPDWNYAFSGADIVPGAKLDTNYQTDANLDTVAYYKGNTDQKGPCTVGTKIPNRLGLYDMSGGICEWTYDFINSDYSIDDTPYLVDGVVKDPMGTETGTLHSVRGGSYFSSAFYCTNTYILSSAATLKKFSYGFRLCRNAE